MTSPETLDDVIAEMREMAKHSRTDSFGNCRAVATKVESWADRLTALRTSHRQEQKDEPH